MNPIRFLFSSLALVIFTTAVWAVEPEPVKFDTSRFVPVNTFNLLGSPDPLPPLVVEKAFPSLSFIRPVALTNAGDGSGRIFVLDQPGLVYVFPEDNDVKKAEVFLDVSEKILSPLKSKPGHPEDGLLGLAFHPDYKNNGIFFTYYTAPSALKAPPAPKGKPQKVLGKSIISRWKVSKDPDKADAASEVVLFEVEQPYGNHNGGSLEFGPDGMLYVPFGDGGLRDDPHANGQNLSTLLATVVRIDVDRKDPGKEYAIPPDNPFVGEAGKKFGEGTRGEIWAYGFRNPWRMAFDSLTGDLWLGDVGQNLWEEIDIVNRGGNYGWKIREGKHAFENAKDAKSTGQPFSEPVWEYKRADGRSITGGLVYRGKKLPELYGTYFYGDFATFNIWGLRYDGKKVTSNSLIARSQLPVTAYGETEAGEVYILSFEGAAGEDTRKLKFGQVFNLQKGGIYRFARRAVAEKKGKPQKFPRKLSETGFFTNMKTLEAAPGLIPFDVNVPLWSDGAAKERYIALPIGGKVKFSSTGHWQFPVGTVMVKTFSLGDAKRLETRLMVHSDRGWDGYTYLWNDERTEAQLLDSALRRDYKVGKDGAQQWYYPSRSDCNSCHTKVAGFVLGVNTHQLNRVLDYGGEKTNQLAALSNLGIFDSKVGKPSDHPAYPDWNGKGGDGGALARAYLDVNCSVCHAPGGTGVAKADLRFNTPLDKTGILNAEPVQKRFTVEGSRVVLPGQPKKSELLLRMMLEGNGRMPTIASSKIDEKAVKVIKRWIRKLPAE
ncbi:MAG: PQQ-dependent sugar dehydrogenase [Planctomycetota bacterium]|nr:PQQ-dependent sugar dehydrogenase [Planctomycetota bacterium]